MSYTALSGIIFSIYMYFVHSSYTFVFQLTNKHENYQHTVLDIVLFNEQRKCGDFDTLSYAK